LIGYLTIDLQEQADAFAIAPACLYSLSRRSCASIFWCLSFRRAHCRK